MIIISIISKSSLRESILQVRKLPDTGKGTVTHISERLCDTVG